LRQEGTVKITFTIASNGRVVSKRISKSSGHALLDREVQDMLDRASPLPRIPSNLNRSSITITLPVAFNLR
jgi:protein TonB